MCTTFAAYRSWWADVAPRRPETTARTYRYHVLRFLADTRSDPTTIRHGEVERYLAGLSNQHRSAVRSALADFFGFLHRRGLRADNPLADAAPVRRRCRAQRKALEPEELARLVVAAVWLGHGRERWTGERTAWGILAQYASGARPGELALLSTEDLSLNGQSSSVYVRATKTGTDRTVPLGPLGRAAFGELARGRAGRLLGVGTPEWWRKIRRAALAAGIPASKAKPYCLRHSAATHMLERGAPMRVVAEILGHVDIRTTMGYTIPRDDERRRAVDLLG